MVAQTAGGQRDGLAARDGGARDLDHARNRRRRAALGLVRRVRHLLLLQEILHGRPRRAALDAAGGARPRYRAAACPRSRRTRSRPSRADPSLAGHGPRREEARRVSISRRRRSRRGSPVPASANFGPTAAGRPGALATSSGTGARGQRCGAAARPPRARSSVVVCRAAAGRLPARCEARARGVKSDKSRLSARRHELPRGGFAPRDATTRAQIWPAASSRSAGATIVGAENFGGKLNKVSRSALAREF